MISEEFKSKINSLYRNCNGKMTDSMLAEHLGVSTREIRRYKKGKLPAKYRRDSVMEKLKKTWVHYEGQENEEPQLNERQ